MAKAGQGPPDSGARPSVAPTPPEIPIDDLSDEAAEWPISEFTGEVVTEPVAEQDGAPPNPDGPTEFHWIEPGADPSDAALLTTPPRRSDRPDTPPPVPVPPPAPRDNGATPPDPLYLVEHGALPEDPAASQQTPAGGSDEVIILEPPPVPLSAPATPARPVPTAASARPAPASARPAPAPPPPGDRRPATGAGDRNRPPEPATATPAERSVREAVSPTPPVPPPPAAADAPRAPAGRAPAPPPVPATAASILLPDIPVELVGAAPGAWPEALSQRPRKKRLRPWFEEVFDEDYLRTLPFMTAEQTLREVAFIKDALSPPADGQVLDIACGYGRHAIELGQRGLQVTGLDLSLPLLIRAADEAQRRSLAVNFVHADMREMAFDSQFDGAYCILSSFGYFDEETNLKVATAICKALKPGARFLLDTLNRDYIVADLPTRVWWEGDGCVVLEEVDFNFHTSRVIIRRSVVFQDGRQVEQDISIRAYSLHELGKLLRQAGFRVLDVSGSLATKGHFFGATSRNIIMVCERPNG
jgi:SAM-dependent methyltransferase